MDVSCFASDTNLKDVKLMKNIKVTICSWDYSQRTIPEGGVKCRPNAAISKVWGKPLPFLILVVGSAMQAVLECTFDVYIVISY